MQTDNDNRTNNVTEKCLDWLELVNTARKDSAKSQNVPEQRQILKVQGQSLFSGQGHNF